MARKRKLAIALTGLALCTTLLMSGCRKEDGKIENNENNTSGPATSSATNTPIESAESIVPDAVERMIP